MNDSLLNLKASAAAVVSANAGLRTNGEPASLRTQQVSMETAMANCGRLHKLGYYLEDVSGLKEKHVEALVKSWHSDGFSNKTIQNNFSRLKIFCGWLGKEGIAHIDGAVHYLEEMGVSQIDLRVKTVTDDSKSWSGNGIDVIEKIQIAYREDYVFGMMMEMGLTFGLRRKEQLKIKPWAADKGNYLELDGSITKGGRYRAMPLEKGELGELQKVTLAKVKKWCKKYQHLGWEGLTYDQGVNRYKHFVRRLGFSKSVLGVCMHGLRAEYSENMLMLRGLIPPSLGGSISQMSKAQRVEITAAVSNLLGHGPDGHTIGAYAGSFKNYKKADGIGSLMGPVILYADQDLVGQIYCNPPVVKTVGGTYKKQSVKAVDKLALTAVIFKDGEEIERVGLKEFLEKHPVANEKVKTILSVRGLENFYAD